MDRIGAAPVFRGGFELNTKSGVVDVQQCLFRGDLRPSTADHEWPAQSDTCWIELDWGGERASYFYSLRELRGKEQALSKLLDRSQMTMLLQKGRLCYVGVMSGRPGRGVRAVTEERLDRMKGVETRLLRRLLPADQEIRPCYHLQGKAWCPELGFEFRPSSAFLPTFLERAQGEGFLDGEQRTLVEAWPACVPPTVWWLPRPLLEAASYLPIFRRTLSHFKLVWEPPDSWTLKVYLYFQLEDWKGQGSVNAEVMKRSQGSTDPVMELCESERSLVKGFLLGTLSPEMEARLELWNYAFGVRWWMRYLRETLLLKKV